MLLERQSLHRFTPLIGLVFFALIMLDITTLIGGGLRGVLKS